MAYKNKADQAVASRSHYEKYRDTIIANSKRTKKNIITRNKTHVLNYLSKHPCVDCGESDPIVLEFDHVRGTKEADISNMVQRGLSLVKIDSEIDKCDVRCANCHRRVTHQRRSLS